jgi:hypothetical protein
MVFLPFKVFTSTESDEEAPNGPTQARQMVLSQTVLGGDLGV